ncbi:hypothetical protein GTY54_16325 [Streptomyces sp. SID625]|nr:hypothetical protein [Streptomyces sp. SID625]
MTEVSSKDDERLVGVRSVSCPRPDHSHLRSTAIRQTSYPSAPLPSGRPGHRLDHERSGDPFKGLSAGTTVPPLMPVNARRARSSGSAL